MVKEKMPKWSELNKFEKTCSIIVLILCAIVVIFSICSWIGVIHFSYLLNIIYLFVLAIVTCLIAFQYKAYSKLVFNISLIAAILFFISGLITLIAHLKN